MKPIESHKAQKELRRLCAANGIDFSIEPVRGGGSHRAAVFTDPNTGRGFSFTFPAGKEISPGVQRHAIRYVESLIGKAPRAEIVKRILESVFSS